MSLCGINCRVTLQNGDTYLLLSQVVLDTQTITPTLTSMLRDEVSLTTHQIAMTQVQPGVHATRRLFAIPYRVFSHHHPKMLRRSLGSLLLVEDDDELRQNLQCVLHVRQQAVPDGVCGGGGGHGGCRGGAKVRTDGTLWTEIY